MLPLVAESVGETVGTCVEDDGNEVVLPALEGAAVNAS